MPDILIRGVSASSLRLLKERAKRNGRSLQGEAKRMLEQGAGGGKEKVLRLFEKWNKKLAGRKFTPSAAELIRQDRRR